jgi:hypothetical protein
MKTAALIIAMLSIISLNLHASKRVSISILPECQAIFMDLDAIIHERAVGVGEVGNNQNLEEAKESAKALSKDLDELSALIETCKK